MEYPERNSDSVQFAWLYVSFRMQEAEKECKKPEGKVII